MILTIKIILTIICSGFYMYPLEGIWENKHLIRTDPHTQMCLLLAILHIAVISGVVYFIWN